MSFERKLAFDTSHEEFVRGFEAGRIWVLMEENPEKLRGMLIHASNAEMVLRMMEYKGIPLTAYFMKDEMWMRLDV